MIIVYSNRTKNIDDPKKPVGADQAMSRVVEHLKRADKFSGGIKRDEKAMQWWKEWYHKHREDSPQDPILRQFHQTMAMQVLKIALLLVMTEPKGFETRIMEADHLQAAEQMLTSLFPNVIKLTSGIGRNELAGVGTQLLDFIDRTGGMQTEVNVLKYFRRYATMPEFAEICNSYIKTGDLIVSVGKTKDGTQRMMYFTPAGHEEYKKMIEQQK